MTRITAVIPIAGAAGIAIFTNMLTLFEDSPCRPILIVSTCIEARLKLILIDSLIVQSMSITESTTLTWLFLTSIQILLPGIKSLSLMLPRTLRLSTNRKLESFYSFLTKIIKED